MARPEFKNTMELILFNNGFKRAVDLANRLSLFFNNIQSEGSNYKNGLSINNRLVNYIATNAMQM